MGSFGEEIVVVGIAVQWRGVYIYSFLQFALCDPPGHQ